MVIRVAVYFFFPLVLYCSTVFIVLQEKEKGRGGEREREKDDSPNDYLLRWVAFHKPWTGVRVVSSHDCQLFMPKQHRQNNRSAG